MGATGIQKVAGTFVMARATRKRASTAEHPGTRGRGPEERYLFDQDMHALRVR